MNNSKILIYKKPNSNIKIDVRPEDKTIWLKQAQMRQLFRKDIHNIYEYIRNIFKEFKLDEKNVIRKLRKTVSYFHLPFTPLK